ncbi:hypothetical protein N9F08_00670 [bacterium]|nr:hypothetical protein [bacterium]
MEILQDSNYSISSEEVFFKKAEFRSYDRDLLDQNIKGYWIRFSIHSRLKTEEKFHLNTGYFDSVEVYLVNNKKELQLINESGYLIPRKLNSNAVHRINIVDIVIGPGENNTYYVRLCNKSAASRQVAPVSLSVGFDILTPEHFQTTFFDFRDHTLLISGALLIMFLFNLLLAIKGKDASYYWLALYNFFFCFTGLNSFAYSISLGLIDNYELIQSLHFYLPYVLILTYLMFSIHFLELKKNDQVLYKILLGFGGLVLLSILIHLIGSSLYAVVFIEFSTLTGFVVLFGTAIRVYRKGHKTAIYIIIGSSLIATFFINFALGVIIESRDYYFYEFLVLVAAFLELILFTYAVVQKFVTARNEAIELVIKKQLLESQKEQLTTEVIEKSKELTVQITNETSRHQQVSELVEILEKSRVEEDGIERARIIAKRIISDSSLKRDFLRHFNGVHKDFVHDLVEKHPNLTANEIKLCAYLRMNLNSLDISILQGVEKSSVNQARYRLRNKLGLEKQVDLVVYMGAI